MNNEKYDDWRIFKFTNSGWTVIAMDGENYVDETEAHFSSKEKALDYLKEKLTDL